jgi:hypothetical protein
MAIDGMSEPVNEAEVLDFVRAQLGSVYTLELMIRLKQSPGRLWQSGELVRELRSSRTAVADGLDRLKRASMVREDPAGCFFFAPASSEGEALAVEIERIYTSKPISVVKAIMAAPDDKLRAFSDAFKLKE